MGRTGHLKQAECQTLSIAFTPSRYTGSEHSVQIPVGARPCGARSFLESRSFWEDEARRAREVAGTAREAFGGCDKGRVILNCVAREKGYGSSENLSFI